MSRESGFRIDHEDVGNCFAVTVICVFMGDCIYSKCVCGLCNFVVWVVNCVFA